MIGGRATRLGALFVLLVACTQEGTDLSPAPTPGSGDPTYYDHVASILAARCSGCHVAGGLAPFALTAYDDARAHASAIARETAARRMPPWNARTGDTCTPPHGYQRDLRLSDAEIATLARWATTGAAAGTPRAIHGAAGRLDRLEGATLELSPRAPYAAPEGRDSHRCFVMDPSLPNGGWVTGVHVVPGNRRIVHHAMVYTDPGGIASAAADATGGFDCPPTGAPGVVANPQSLLLDVWTPGVEPIELPPRVGMHVAAGAKIVLAMHYSASAGTAEPDLSRVQLRLTHERPEYLLVTTGIGNFTSRLAGGDGLLPGPSDGPDGAPVFRVPAGSRDHVEQMQITIGDVGGPVRLYGVMAHMHLAGKDMAVSLYDPASDWSTCLLHERWDFHWQRMYAFDAPLDALPVLSPGQKIRLRCTYDNTRDNLRLAAALAERRMEPRDAVLGDGTLDEMCLFVPQFLVRTGP
jgi:hypothetical protein